MEEAKWVTIIFEINCYEKKDNQATIWMFAGKVWDKIDDAIEGFHEVSGAIKVIGPVDWEIAEQVNAAIVRVMKDVGINVDAQTAADD